MKAYSFFYVGLGNVVFKLNYRIINAMPARTKRYLVERMLGGLWTDENSLDLTHTITSTGEIRNINDANLKSEAGVFTGESVIMTKGVNLGELGIPTDSLGSMRRGFRNWFTNGGIDLMEAVEDGNPRALELSRKLGTNLEARTLRTLVHEYIHWRSLKETSMATIIDAVSWRVELDQSVFAEASHRVGGIGRRLNEDTINYISENKDEIVKNMSEAQGAESILYDLATHGYFLSLYYPAMISVLMEPVAWALVEDDLVKEKEKYLDYYFSYLSAKSRHIAEEILDRSVEYLKDGTRTSLVEACRRALDFPLKEAESERLIGEVNPSEATSQLERAHGLLRDRFLKSLEGRVEVETRRNKSFRKSIVYATKKTAHNPFSLDIVMENLEPAIYGLSMMTSRFAKLALDRPSFLVYSRSPDGDPVILVYDISSPHIMSKDSYTKGGFFSTQVGKPIYRLMDMVGDVGYTLVPSLLILYYSSFVGKVDDEIILKQLVNLGFPIRFFDPSGYKSYLRLVKKILDGSFSEWKSLYSSLITEGNGFQDFMDYWLSLIEELGPASRFLYSEQGMQS
ncbi:hypothetical protein GWK48_07390 [Metallosphaera tengchongensis]|uniref:Uncharacterized protein n=1 Tax=Metallosphaera tengchongensis TaxID=1532350 RepID=A0A6N0NYK3_9CREN|nr:hypothetical protein [Metallosphaera tengchongensis]QKR00221.1 hypothetical protein GWK48_07390 [Metallosphaera tengchongensis]